MIHFYDAANPENVPSGVYAAVYVNGFAWSQAQQDRMARIFRVSVVPGASWASHARCLDIESGAASPSDLPAFVIERRRLGFDDATGYVNRSNWLAAYNACKAAKIAQPLWWVSTLDGTQNVELRDGSGRQIAVAWAVQYQGGMHSGYDLSVLHGVNNFVLP